MFTSESVTEGHPDKVCDAISDAILDACMEQDPMSRVACETATCTGFVLVTGEITTNARFDYQEIVRRTITDIGYDRAKYGFDGNTCAVFLAIDQQSADIAMGVDNALETKADLKALEQNMSDEELGAIGAGDQGMMFGYAGPIRSRWPRSSARSSRRCARTGRFPTCGRTANPRSLWNTMRTESRPAWRRWSFPRSTIRT